MTRKTIATHQPQSRRVRQLSDLGLSKDDFCALRRRGTVSREKRHGRVVFKLRFRTETGRQCVRYIGNDPSVADVIRCELQDLQLHRRVVADLKRLEAKARKLLRHGKKDSEGVIEAIGFYYHGFSLRKRRGYELAKDIDGRIAE